MVDQNKVTYSVGVLNAWRKAGGCRGRRCSFRRGQPCTQAAGAAAAEGSSNPHLPLSHVADPLAERIGDGFLPRGNSAAAKTSETTVVARRALGSRLGMRVWGVYRSLVRLSCYINTRQARPIAAAASAATAQQQRRTSALSCRRSLTINGNNG